MKVIFAGTPVVAVPSLQALVNNGYEIVGVYTQPDRPAGRGQHLHESPVKQFAKQHHLPIFQPNTLKDLAAQKELQRLNADIMVVVAYGMLLPEVVLTMPRFGCINAHLSLLPRWRGAAPMQRAIQAGDAETGVTIMQIDVGLDTGDIWHQEKCIISPETTAQTLHDHLAQLSADTLIKILPQITAGKLQCKKQDNTLTCHAAKITKQEANINWQKSAIEIERMIRAFNPFPITYSFIDKKLVRIWQAMLIQQETSLAPGTIIKADKEGIDVATADGIIRLLTLQLAGGKPLPVHELLNAHAKLFTSGNRFSHE